MVSNQPYSMLPIILLASLEEGCLTGMSLGPSENFPLLKFNDLLIQPGLEGVFLIIGCIGSSAPTKLVRSEIIQQRGAPFVTALGAFGFSNSYIMFKALLPICILPAIFSLLYAIPELIGIEVGLSFFGLGAQPPIPSLGRLIYDGLSEFYSAWWLTLIPASVLFVLTSTIYCFAPSAGARQ